MVNDGNTEPLLQIPCQTSLVLVMLIFGAFEEFNIKKKT
jgi:hypothetical protein